MFRIIGSLFSRADPLSNVELQFDTRESAIAYAETQENSRNISPNILASDLPAFTLPRQGSLAFP
eukprot:gene8441-14425_t